MHMPPRDLVLISTCGLLAIGAVMVQSAGMTVLAPGTMTDIGTHRAVLLALLAILAWMVGRFLPQSWMRSPAIAISGLSVAVILLLLVFVPGLGREVNGARRWLSLGPLGFQPSEVAKWSLVIFLAWYAVKRHQELGTWTRGLLPAMAITALICGLVILEDLGTAIMIGCVAMLILLAAGSRLKHLLLLGTGALGIVILAIRAEPYRIARLHAFLDPWADPGGNGYHVIQSLKALTAGGVGGHGLGSGLQKFGYLPEDTTDFIFAIIVEELGLLGCLLVTGLFTGLVYAGWSIVQQTRAPHAQLLALGITATISIQGLVNLLVVTGLAPTTGIALPLVSSGGTGWILTAFMLGCLAGLDPTPSLRSAPRLPQPTGSMS